MTPERELLREARDELRWCSGSSDFNEGGQARKGWIKGPQAVLNKIDAFFAQPESPQQAVPAGCVECMQEASEVLSEERMPRGPLADELWGFSLMLRDNAAQATPQSVLDAYTRCADQVPSTWIDPLLSGPDAVILGGSDGMALTATTGNSWKAQREQEPPEEPHDDR